MMKKIINKNQSISLTKASFWTATFFLLQIIAVLLSMYLKSKFDPIYWANLKSILKEVLEYANNGQYVEYYANLMKSYFSLIGELVNLTFILLLVPYALILFFSAKKAKINPFKKVSGNNTLKLIACGLGLNLGISIVLNTVLPLLPESMVSSLTSSTGAATGGSLLFTLFITGLVGPVIEEITFRYGAQRALKKGFSTKTALILQALMFGAAHGNVIQGVYTFILGLAFGYIYEKSGENLFTPIICHAAINSSSVLVSALGFNEYIALAIPLIVVLVIVKLTNKEKSNTLVPAIN